MHYNKKRTFYFKNEAYRDDKSSMYVNISKLSFQSIYIVLHRSKEKSSKLCPIFVRNLSLSLSLSLSVNVNIYIHVYNIIIRKKIFKQINPLSLAFL